MSNIPEERFLSSSLASLPLFTSLSPEEGVGLENQKKLRKIQGHYILTLSTLASLSSPLAQEERDGIEATLSLLKQLYERKRTQRFDVSALVSLGGTDKERGLADPEAGSEAYRSIPPHRPVSDAEAISLSRWLTYLSELSIFIKPSFDPETGFLKNFALSDVVLYLFLWGAPNVPSLASPWRLASIVLDGYRPFLRTRFPLSALSLIYGPYSSGKTGFFSALRLLAFVSHRPLPSSFAPFDPGGRPFTTSAPEAIRYEVEISSSGSLLRYEIEIHGEGPPKIFRERAWIETEGQSITLLAATVGRGVLLQEGVGLRALPFQTSPNESALSYCDEPSFGVLYRLRSYLSSISPYFGMSLPVGEIVRLLSSLPRTQLEAVQDFLRANVEGFDSLRVDEKAPQVFWREEKLREEAPIGALSESVLRLLSLVAVCFSVLPALLCIDNPERGVSPSLQGAMYRLLQLVSQRTQVIVSLDFLPASLLEGVSVLRLSRDSGRPLAKT